MTNIPARVRLDRHGNMAAEEGLRPPHDGPRPKYVGRPLIPVLDELNVLAGRERHIFNRLKDDFWQALWMHGFGELQPAAVGQ